MPRLRASSHLSLIRRFHRDERGNVALIFALTAVPMLMMGGIAIDYGANSNARQQAQNAVDAATLSLAKQPLSLTAQQLTERATAQVTAAMARTQVSNLVITSSRTDNNYTVTVTGNTPTTLTRIAGFQSLPLKVTSTTRRGSGNLEVAMVLDNTGSMSGSKLANLKSAATEMVNNLFAQVDPTKPNSLKMAVVPFSQTVNVGASNVGANWLDTLGLASYHSQIFNSKANRLALFNAMGLSWAGCVEGRAKPYDVSDTTASATTPDSLYVPYFAPDESDKDNTANDYLNDYTSIIDRLFSNASNRTRQGLIDKYASRSWKVSSSDRNGPNYSMGPNAGCSVPPITPLTTSQSTVTSAITALNASGSTNIPIGLAWGWNAVSPNGPLVKGADYSDQTTRKFIILMTDGRNEVNYVNNSNGSVYTGISYIWADRVANLSESSSNSARTDALDARLTLLCTNIKNAGIQIFTVRVEDSSGTSELLQSCASNPSMFYDVADSSNLTAAFQAIGAQISELRISR